MISPKKIREQIDGLELRLITLMYENGKEAALEGVTLLNPDNHFILGALVKSAYKLYRRSEGEKKEFLLSALKRFFTWTKDEPCKTWGKLSLLSVLCAMKERGELALLPEGVFECLREKTDFRDFYDIREKKLLGPTAANYIHVAASCAKQRQMLGWESEETVSVITEHLLSTVDAGVGDGFLDDQPGEGRFDSYTFMVAKSLPEQCEEAGLPVPAYALKNLATAARAMLKMANRHGDGFVYGRSLAVYGDMSPAGVFVSAMKYGLLSEEESELAYAYILKILEKLCCFWYDEKRGIFNIWLDGRSTDGYREVHRLLETNLDVCDAIYETLEALETLGFAERTPRVAIPSPDTWQASRIFFSDTPYKKAETIILRRKDTLLMLPLIGAGSLCSFPAYLPFPAVAGVFEAAPQSSSPYLVPEFEMDEKLHRPIRFYTDISMDTQDDNVTVRARGYLAAVGPWPARPERTEYTFESEYVFDGNEISVSFKTDMPYGRVRMHTAETARASFITAFGFEEVRELPLGAKDTLAPHGAYTYVREHTSHSRTAVGWHAVIPE